MRCFVTGVAGFVGSSIADRLLAQGHEVVGVDCFVDYYPRALKEGNLAAARQHASFRFIEGSLLDLDLNELLVGVDWVFHQAAQAGVRASWGADFAIYTDNNILATQRLLEACKSAPVRATLKKVVYASSSSVYGNAETLPTLESICPQPISPYGVSKLAAEHLMVLYSTQFAVPTVSLRYFTVYGPRQRPDMAFHRFCRAGILGEQIHIYGDGEQSRDFTFIDDIVTANIQAAESSGSGEVYNLGGGSRVTVNQVLKVIEGILGNKLNVVYQDKQKGDAAHTAADTTLAQRKLGFKPTVTVEQGLEREAAWMKDLLAAKG